VKNKIIGIMNKDYKFISAQVSEEIFKYHLVNSDNKKVTYAEFITLLKEEDAEFLEIFTGALNEATNKLGAYF